MTTVSGVWRRRALSVELLSTTPPPTGAACSGEAISPFY